ncbi:GntR family transcriptional regulator [uncultured Schumannella sp.]|uniref:GntR family transcriptional regulator n=1 Tax=uncultured Schumannella sp. TaxID=1195956 RepID=UPI0025D8A173|nr:GntR family transcriptional regulator [uncultured Schumannella sp.]
MSTRVQVTGIVDAVAAELRALVLAGELVPGRAVTEAIVAERFSVARPSAKAAIEKLVAEGLLERSAHRSARVPKLDAEAVLDVYATRRRIESSALRELATRRLAPTAARAANAEIAALATRAPELIVDPDMRFHAAIVDALASPRTSRAYSSLLGEVRLCMAQVQGQRLISVELIHREHAEVLDALEAGDENRAIEVLSAHLGRASERLAEAARIR